MATKVDFLNKKTIKTITDFKLLEEYLVENYTFSEEEPVSEDEIISLNNRETLFNDDGIKIADRFFEIVADDDNQQISYRISNERVYDELGRPKFEIDYLSDENFIIVKNIDENGKYVGKSFIAVDSEGNIQNASHYFYMGIQEIHLWNFTGEDSEGNILFDEVEFAVDFVKNIHEVVDVEDLLLYRIDNYAGNELFGYKKFIYDEIESGNETQFTIKKEENWRLIFDDSNELVNERIISYTEYEVSEINNVIGNFPNNTVEFFNRANSISIEELFAPKTLGHPSQKYKIRSKKFVSIPHNEIEYVNYFVEYWDLDPEQILNDDKGETYNIFNFFENEDLQNFFNEVIDNALINVYIEILIKNPENSLEAMKDDGRFFFLDETAETAYEESSDDISILYDLLFNPNKSVDKFDEDFQNDIRTRERYYTIKGKLESFILYETGGDVTTETNALSDGRINYIITSHITDGVSKGLIYKYKDDNKETPLQIDHYENGKVVYIECYIWDNDDLKYVIFYDTIINQMINYDVYLSNLHIGTKEIILSNNIIEKIIFYDTNRTIINEKIYSFINSNYKLISLIEYENKNQVNKYEYFYKNNESNLITRVLYYEYNNGDNSWQLSQEITYNDDEFVTLEKNFSDDIQTILDYA